MRYYVVNVQAGRGHSSTTHITKTSGRRPDLGERSNPIIPGMVRSLTLCDRVTARIVDDVFTLDEVTCRESARSAGSWSALPGGHRHRSRSRREPGPVTRALVALIRRARPFMRKAGRRWD